VQRSAAGSWVGEGSTRGRIPVERHVRPGVENIGPPGVSRILARWIACLACPQVMCSTSTGETSTLATFRCNEHLVQ
jgi:hypothetical protein